MAFEAGAAVLDGVAWTALNAVIWSARRLRERPKTGAPDAPIDLPELIAMER
ncbi:hypothetical protein HS048_01035 [Planomonospora sp. ID91781]|uniref:hypothetical protein n=1 Tax=Planomonospora sp. ID91781 TaxID=2738135 RepID=UPI0018C37A3E|nr:hypothetical protein [Planomonospora sp. ID91781]MBG0819348.1 hypothetical protein [Planomonospora sp. ID91781]